MSNTSSFNTNTTCKGFSNGTGLFEECCTSLWNATGHFYSCVNQTLFGS